MKKHQDGFESEFGCSIEDIGVHSIGKGAATYISSGSTCAPPQVATNIRAGWSMGTIQDTYLRYEAAGDQYVGRVACGLPIHSAKFGVLPPEIIIDDQLLDDVSNIKLGLVEEIYPSLPVSLKRTVVFDFFSLFSF